MGRQGGASKTRSQSRRSTLSQNLLRVPVKSMVLNASGHTKSTEGVSTAGKTAPEGDVPQALGDVASHDPDAPAIEGDCDGIEQTGQSSSKRTDFMKTLLNQAAREWKKESSSLCVSSQLLSATTFLEPTWSLKLSRPVPSITAAQQAGRRESTRSQTDVHDPPTDPSTQDTKSHPHLQVIKIEPSTHLIQGRGYSSQVGRTPKGGRAKQDSGSSRVPEEKGTVRVLDLNLT
ncbi:hypothetical protein M231_04597 [Tremella mesenterica]|uniref:Uncharacterized protein n=1 Tax=Tremella mesenterica TaxID=5217 RepID=A0A4Q1BKC9_TREME|nr:hypothetical protein M231_04597 [Tremella mesenterica]